MVADRLPASDRTERGYCENDRYRTNRGYPLPAAPGIAELVETYPSEWTRENWAAQLFCLKS